MQQEYLRRLQLTEKEILDEIVRICEENSLEYFLIGGTLLGAVRHKGFIPWDDDLDIVMPRPDYDKFCKLCIDGALREEYHLHSLDTDPEYWLIFAKRILFLMKRILPVLKRLRGFMSIFFRWTKQELLQD